MSIRTYRVKHVPEYDTIEKVQNLFNDVLVEHKKSIEELNVENKKLFDTLNRLLGQQKEYEVLQFNEAEQLRHFAKLIINDVREFDEVSIEDEGIDLVELAKTIDGFICWVG
jgi:hypothetical protein